MKSETMEYQTARDLPFAKAGTKVGLSLSEGCIPMSLYDIKDCEVVISKEFIGQLLCEGWIKSAKSVKPREFYLLDSEQMCDRIFYYNMEEAKTDAADWAIKELIKVQVIE